MLGTLDVRLTYNFPPSENSVGCTVKSMLVQEHHGLLAKWFKHSLLTVKMHSSATKMITLSFSKKFSLTLGKQISLILQSWNKFNEFCHKRLEKRTDCCHIPWKLWKISFSDQSCFLSPSSIGNKMWFSVLLRVFFWGF